MGVLGVKNAKIWISYQTAGSIGTNFGTHVQIHLEMVMGEINISSSRPQGGLGGFRGPEIQKYGITTKRMDQLALNLAHMCGFI